MTVFQASGINPRHYTQGYSDTDRPLPWDHINIGVDRSFLLEEKARAVAGKITNDCRTGSCRGCGVCDFESIKPVSFHDHKGFLSTQKPLPEPQASETAIKYVVSFKKMKAARFLGHLEMVKIFTRSLRRERLPLKYSKGFHPMPKVSFGDTLPMGMQSEDERMLVTLTEPIDSGELISRLRRQMPDGLEITGCSPYVKKKALERIDTLPYRVELKDGFFKQKDLDWFFGQQSVTIERKSKKGRPVAVDLKKAVSDIRLLDDHHAVMTLGTDNNLMVRPGLVMKTVFNLSELQILTAIITKRKTNHV